MCYDHGMPQRTDDDLAEQWHNLMGRYHRLTCAMDRASKMTSEKKDKAMLAGGGRPYVGSVVSAVRVRKGFGRA